jgi:hypothetical protein
MFRFSLRFVFVSIAIVAAVLFAIINYSPFVRAICCNGLFVAIAIAAIGAAASRGSRRAFLAGFAATALVCAWAAFGKLERSFTDALVNHQFVDWMFQQMHKREANDAYIERDIPGDPRDGENAIRLSDGTVAKWDNHRHAYVTGNGQRIIPIHVFRAVGHCGLAIVLGLAGGGVAAAIWSIGQRKKKSRQSLVAARSAAEPRTEEASPSP